MGLIKSSNVPAGVMPFSMRDIEAQALAVLSRARAQAEELLADARREAEELKQAAWEEGLESGRAEGLARGIEEGARAGAEQALAEQGEAMAHAVEALSAAMQDLQTSRRALEAAALQEVVELAIAVARRVTKRQALIDPVVLEENLKEAMRLVVNRADVRIAVHPQQRATLQAALPALKLEWPGVSHVQLIDDPSLAVGGCRVFTAQGRVDADLDAQLDRVVADLLPRPEQFLA